MNARERFLGAMLFGAPDRIPLEPGHARLSTRKNWYAQGLPRGVKDINEYAYRQGGGALDWPKGGETLPVDERMIPQFEEKVLERRDRTQIVQDWKGNVCEISNEYSPRYLREAIDFVTRRWIKCPVETRTDWENMKNRYDARDPARFGEDLSAMSKRLKGRDWPVTLHFSGPFWQMREWLGFEKLCVLFREDPDFVQEMASFWGDHVLVLMETVLAHAVPDMVHVSEDMAFKNHAMISPAMVRKFLLPVYAKWGEALRKAGCRIYAIDSDGYIDELIPVWLDAGVNACDPVEVAAGNDLPTMRRKYGAAMAFRGGVDKRAIAAGGHEIVSEIHRLLAVIKSGGYIPGCDHGVPANVTWPDYVRYVGVLAKATGW